MVFENIKIVRIAVDFANKIAHFKLKLPSGTYGAAVYIFKLRLSAYDVSLNTVNLGNRSFRKMLLQQKYFFKKTIHVHYKPLTGDHL